MVPTLDHGFGRLGCILIFWRDGIQVIPIIYAHHFLVDYSYTSYTHHFLVRLFLSGSFRQFSDPAKEPATQHDQGAHRIILRSQDTTVQPEFLFYQSGTPQVCWLVKISPYKYKIRKISLTSYQPYSTSCSP